jgi:hypothetical protein
MPPRRRSYAKWPSSLHAGGPQGLRRRISTRWSTHAYLKPRKRMRSSIPVENRNRCS